ncbi:MAG: c-type cytochrome [Sphingobacteriia bacterium]|nr:c-type cytochrome [Sphingobacteriia bacterium]
MANHLKKIITMSALVVAGVITVSSFTYKKEQPKPKKLVNIKVLPADWTYQQVDHLMDEFKVELGVKCNYCHAPSKEDPKKMDMASDNNKVKDIARDMIRMTDDINKKYVSLIPHADSVKVQAVTCNTCHRGQAKPKVEVVTKPQVAPAK